MNEAGSIYINHTEKEIRYCAEPSVYTALSQIGWDPENVVECHNLYFADLLLVVKMHLTTMIVDLVKEHCYTISGAAAAQLWEESGLGDGYIETDNDNYIYDKEMDAILCIETGEYKKPPSECSSIPSSISSSSLSSSYAISSNAEEEENSTIE
jgi:hypothetical protein